MKKRTITASDIKLAEAPPLSNEMQGVSNRIAIDVESGNYGTVESAGMLSMAALLDMYASGTLGKREAYSFLSTLAKTKTPDPVQRVEMDQKVDMRVLVNNIVDNSHKSLQAMLALAEERRDEVKRRLGERSQELMLTESQAHKDRKQWSEPEEISNLRKDGA